MLARISSSRATPGVFTGAGVGVSSAGAASTAGACGAAASCSPAMLARIWSSREAPAMSSVDFCTSSIRPSTELEASSARPIALAYRRSIFSRTSSSDGVLPGAASEDIDSSDRATVSCILACSSWLSSLVRSAIFCWSTWALFSTALRAWVAAFSAWSCRTFRSSMFCSLATSWVAKVCAVVSYRTASSSVPPARDLSARTSAWRAEACSFCTLSISRDSFISS